MSGVRGLSLVMCALIAPAAIADPAQPVKKPAVKKPAVKKQAVKHAAAHVAKRSAKPPAAEAEPVDPRAKTRFTAPADAATTPAVRYAALAPSECLAELDHRGIAYTPLGHDATRGVAAPVRLTGALHGVTFQPDVSAKELGTTPYAITDCRLALALDDFAALLEHHDVVMVKHYSIYRPPPASWSQDKIGSRHDGALAIDASHFIRKDGSSLDVIKDFHGEIGDATCGADAHPHPATAEALELRAILCEAVDARLFNVILTPNYNKPHNNHFHMEVTADVKWFLVH